MTFQEKLVILRKARGLTQDEFASAVGVSRQAVYKWESGQSYPEVQKLLEIKTLFTISIDDLLDDNYDIPVPEKKKRKRISKETKEKIEKSVEKSEAAAAPRAAAPKAAAPAAPKAAAAPIAPAAKEDEPVINVAPSEEAFNVVINDTPRVQESTPAAEEEKKTSFFGKFFTRK